MKLIACLFLLAAISANAASPVPSVTPSRTSGIAPLCVFFDATGTTDADTTKPFHTLRHTANFGDGSAGAYTYGAKVKQSKNAYSGAGLAVHCYSTAGTYTVTWSVTDGTNTVAADPMTITVSAPDTAYATTATVCVNTSAPTAGQDGCPTGAATATATDFCSAVNANIGTTKRVLFRRGVTFACASAVTITAQGPWTIGAYGAGTGRAIVSNAQTGGETINIGAGAGVSREDGRIMDIEFTESGSGNGSIRGVGNFNKLTMYSLKIHAIGDGPEFYAGQIDVVGNSSVWDSLIISNSIIQDINGGSATHGVYAFATRLAIIDTLLDDTLGSEHLLRFDYCSKCVVQGSTLTNGANSSSPAGRKESIAIRGVGQDPATYYFQYVLPAPSPTQFFLTADNVISVSGGSAGIQTGSVNSSAVTIVENILTERNYIYSPVVANCSGSVCGQYAIKDQSSYHTIRNNIFDLSNFYLFTGVGLAQAVNANMAASNNANIYNNSIYSSTNSNNGTIALVNPEVGVTDVNVVNNLGYAPATTSTTYAVQCTPVPSDCSDRSDIVITTNSSGTSGANQIKNTNPFEQTPVSTNPLTYRPSAAAYADTGGTAAYPASTWDFGNCVAANGTDIPIGAWHPKSSVCVGAAKGATQ